MITESGATRKMESKENSMVGKFVFDNHRKVSDSIRNVSSLFLTVKDTEDKRLFTGTGETLP